MKVLIAASLSLFSLASMANMHKHKEMEEKMDKMSFEDAKKMKMEMLDKKSAMISQERGCVSSAKDKTGLKDCMKQMEQDKEGMMQKMEGEMNKKMKK